MFGSERRTAGPGSLSEADRQEAERLFDIAFDLANRFLTYAREKNLISALPGPLAIALWPADHALRLGVGLMSAAYRLKQDARTEIVDALTAGFAQLLLTQAVEQRTRLFTSMIPMLGSAKLEDFPPSPDEVASMRNLAAIQLDESEKAIAGAVRAVSRGDVSPLQSFYGDLVPAFGGPAEPPVIDARYGGTVNELFAEARRRVS